MARQIHRRFTDDQVKFLLELYSKKAISLEQVLRQLECSRGRFYQILKDTVVTLESLQSLIVEITPNIVSRRR